MIWDHFFKININTRNVPSKISVNYWIFLVSYLVHATMEINFLQIKTFLWCDLSGFFDIRQSIVMLITKINSARITDIGQTCIIPDVYSFIATSYICKTRSLWHWQSDVNDDNCFPDTSTLWGHFILHFSVRFSISNVIQHQCRIYVPVYWHTNIQRVKDTFKWTILISDHTR